PETPEYVDVSDAGWRAVLAARPGIAGPTQLVVHDMEADLAAGPDGPRYEDLLPAKLALDAWYVRKASPMLDALVVVALVERFLLGRRRTAVHRRLERDIGSGV